MTKEQYYTKYGITDSFIKADLEAVIATEIEKAKVQEANPQPELKFKIGDRLINFNKGGSYGNVCKLLANCPFELYDINTKTYFITNSLSGYELYTEPTEQPAEPFDKDRFEAMFRAVVASGEFMTIVEEIEQAEIYLTKLDAYYASKEGGNNE